MAAIRKGADTLGSLERVLRLDKRELEEILARLEAQGLVRREKRGILFRKTVYRLTGEGLKRAEEALRRITEHAKTIEEKLRRTSTPDAVEVLGEQLHPLLTLLLWMGLLELPLLGPPLLADTSLDEQEEHGFEGDLDEYLVEDLDSAV